MANNGYSVKVRESSKTLTAREKLMFSDTTNAVKLDDIVTPDNALTITPADYVILFVHNENSENQDYDVYVIITDDGKKYITGSSSFWNSFSDIWDVMHEDEIAEPYQIEIFKKESKNFKGKYFLTCSVI